MSPFPSQPSPWALVHSVDNVYIDYPPVLFTPDAQILPPAYLMLKSSELLDAIDYQMKKRGWLSAALKWFDYPVAVITATGSKPLNYRLLNVPFRAES